MKTLKTFFSKLKRAYPNSTDYKLVYKDKSEITGKIPSIMVYILIQNSYGISRIWDFVFKHSTKPRTVKQWKIFLEIEGRDRFIGGVLPSYNLSRSYYGENQFYLKSVLAWRVNHDFSAGVDSSKGRKNQPAKKGGKR
jgi:hypothetical protein